MYRPAGMIGVLVLLAIAVRIEAFVLMSPLEVAHHGPHQKYDRLSVHHYSPSNEALTFDGTSHDEGLAIIEDGLQEAWRASFSRNNFADFVPSELPEDDPQRCLMLSSGHVNNHQLFGSKDPGTSENFLPWDTKVSRQTHFDEASLPTSSGATKDTLPFTTGGGTLATRKSCYDVILDRGLVDELIQGLTSSTGDDDEAWDAPVQAVLQHASAMIRDNGIYVMFSTPLNIGVQTRLRELGESFGLEWQFHLDGISNEHMGVSVARKMYDSDEVGYSQDDPVVYPVNYRDTGLLP